MIFGRNLKSLEFIPDLTIGGIKIDRVGQSQAEQSVRFLGLWVSDAETFSLHISKIKLKIGLGLFHLASSKDNAPLRIRLSIYRALIESHMRFANIIFGSAPDSLIHELLILQKKAIRHISLSHYRAHTDPLFTKLRILKISDLISLSRACIVHQFRSGHLPDSFNRTFFNFVNFENHSRREDPLCVITPEITYQNMERTPYVMICKAWNAIPYELKIIHKLSEFKKSLTDYYLKSYNDICSLEVCISCRPIA